MKQPAPHGAEEGRLLAALRRLLPIEPLDGGGQIPPSEHGGFGGLPGGLQALQQARSLQGVSSSPSGGGGRRQDGNHHAIRPLRIRPYALRVKECWHDFPEAHGLSAGWPALLHLFG
jgi:hypothetical protein